jgi:hypothetical protein
MQRLSQNETEKQPELSRSPTVYYFRGYFLLEADHVQVNNLDYRKLPVPIVQVVARKHTDRVSGYGPVRYRRWSRETSNSQGCT